jgi:hypothetical protein
MKHNFPLSPIIFIYLHFLKTCLVFRWPEKIIRMRSRQKNIVKLKEYYWFLYLWNNIAQPSIPLERKMNVRLYHIILYISFSFLSFFLFSALPRFTRYIVLCALVFSLFIIFIKKGGKYIYSEFLWKIRKI